MKCLHVRKKGKVTKKILIHSIIDKNLSREDELIKLRSEVVNLHLKYKADKQDFEAKEKLQQEAFNVTLLFVLHFVLTSFYRDFPHPQY